MALRVAIAGAALAFGLAAPAMAACPRVEARVEVRVVAAPPVIDQGSRSDALHTMTGVRDAAAARHLGLTTFRVDWTSEMAAAGEQVAGGACVAPTAVLLTLQQVEHVVRIASEVTPGSCLHAEVLAHEQRHVAVNQASLQAAAERARVAATAWARGAAGRGATTELAAAALRRDLRQAIEPVLARMREEQARGHAAIDTPAEYRRLSRVCPADHALVAARLLER